MSGDKQATEIAEGLETKSEANVGGEGKARIAHQPQGNGNASIGVITAIAVFVSIMTSGAMLVAYDHWVAPRIVSVDIKGYIADQRDLYVAGKITDEQFRANVDRMAAVIEGLPKNRIVVMGDAVIRGAEKVDIGSE